MSTRAFARLVAGLLFAGLVVLQLAGTATAQVEVESVVPRGDGSVDLVLTLERGCDGARTTGLVASLPAGAAVVAVEDPRGWSHTVEEGEVGWTGPVLPAEGGARFVVTARIDAVPGDTVLVPTRQLCADGTEVVWAGTAESTERPAPRFVATAATVDPSARPVAAASESAGAGAGALGATVAVVVFTGLAVALVRRRRVLG